MSCNLFLDVFSSWGRRFLSNGAVTKPRVFETDTVRKKSGVCSAPYDVSSKTQPLSHLTKSCKKDFDVVGMHCACVIILIDPHNTQDKKWTYNITWRRVRTTIFAVEYATTNDATTNDATTNVATTSDATTNVATTSDATTKRFYQ